MEWTWIGTSWLGTCIKWWRPSTVATFSDMPLKRFCSSAIPWASFAILTYAGTNAPNTDIEGIMLTGFMNDQNDEFIVNTLVPAFYPAHMDPKFAGQVAPEDAYLTTLPGTRLGAYFHAPTANAAVVAVDEAFKETLAAGILANPAIMTFVYDTVLPSAVTAPVFVAVGEFDHLFCGVNTDCSNADEVQTLEEAYFSLSSHVSTQVIRDAGHVLNLQTNAGQTFAKMLDFADYCVGP